MKLRFGACLFGIVLFAACKKNGGSSAGEAAAAAAKTIVEVPCGKEIITDKPVKAGETGIMLPVGTKLCISKDEKEVRVELPAGYAFLAKGEAGKLLPVYATYSCGCSVSGSACNVFYAEGMGFGCLQGSCGGSCTGHFTYKGYSVDFVAPTSSRTEFFAVPEVQKEIMKVCSQVSPMESYQKLSVYGVSFYLVNDVKKFDTKASCDCDGTKACTLKTFSVSSNKIYYCDGPCNGCELTVN